MGFISFHFTTLLKIYYMRTTYPNTPLSDFTTDETYVEINGGLDILEENQTDQDSGLGLLDEEQDHEV